MAPTTAPYGTWKSPILADLITQKTISVAEVHVDPVTNDIYHGESRPSEGGRIAIVNTKAGQDVFGPDWNARSGVHEYGGSAFAVRDGVIYFTDFKTKRLYVIKSNNLEAVSPDNENHRFGDLNIHPSDSHLVLSTLEDHTKPAPEDVVNTLVIINTQTQSLTAIAQGADFYSTGRFSPDGTKVSWIQWHHPDMPWEGSELVVADFDASSVSVSNPSVIAGKPGDESINEAFWASNKTLVYLSDKSGFYNPWKYDVGSRSSSPILPKPAEKDYAEPAWLLGASRWTALDENTLLVSPTTNGDASLGLLRIDSGEFTEIKSPYVNLGAVHGVTSSSAVFVGVTDDTPAALIKVTLPNTVSPASGSIDNAVFETLKETSSAASTISRGLFPKHQSIALEIPGSGAPLHVMYFPPTNPDYAGGKDGELPPCVMNIHGGPTSRVAPGLSWTATYFTSRGWAWVDVNYGGSSGYGRDYRERLRGNWGVVDVNDSVTAAQQLSARGLIDGKRVAIRGGSAGGYTVLAAVVTHPLAFTVATSSYGISDLALLASDTHKFESRYLEKLIGGTLQEVPEVYRERSPVFHANKIRAPLLILQGSIDAVVPPGQAEAIVKQIKERDGKVEYVLFEGEGHGWRKAENIKRALETEERWYAEVLRLS
ncbi:hypothetical protein FS837_007660 [Tulasnella sp. UAMH 9824]|nr:hypothetical protein FS837_007660 [Tulasnella sp. UAMH 9824]